MSHTIVYDPIQSFIQTTFQGIVTMKDMEEAISDMCQIAAEKKCHLFVNDFSESTVTVSVFDIYRTPEIFSKAASSYELNRYQMKRAVVFSPTTFREHGFAETIAVNYGQYVKFFTDLNEAKKWLLDS